MTQLQILTEKKRNAKHQMFIAKPLMGYLGNQYFHWQDVYEKTKTKIKNLKLN